MNRELAVGAHELVLYEAGRVLAREAFGAEVGSLPAAVQRLLPTRSPSPVTVRLAASHARMLLLPWLPQLTRPERWTSLAASRFEQTFGEPADGWTLRVAEDLPPRPRVAAAIPNSLLAALRTAARLRAVRIGLLDALGALLQREPAFSGCVAQSGADSACLLMLWRGELRRIRTRRFEAVEELAAAARSEWIAARGVESGAQSVSAAVGLVGKGHEVGAALAGALGCSRVVELA